jgi:hypothetical protein
MPNRMDIHAQTLTGLSALLSAYKEDYWASKVDEALRLWLDKINPNGLDEHFHRDGLDELSLYSETDSHYDSIAKSLFRQYLDLYKRFDPVQMIIKPRTPDDQQRYIHNSWYTRLSSWRCFDFAHTIVSRTNIEDYIYTRLLDGISKQYIERGEFLNFSDYKKLYENEELNAVINQVIAILPDYNIEYSLLDERPNTCSKCKSEDMGYAHWFLDFEKMIITEDTSNLPINKKN